MGFVVMIADDEKMPRDILEKHLPWEELGVSRILQASDGEEAVCLAREHHPHIIISDIKMPRKNGLEMAAQVREFCPDCQFIFLSGYSDKEYLKGAIKVKAASYVEKPIELEEITEALQAVIGEIRAQQPADPRGIFFRGEAYDGSALNDEVFVFPQELMAELNRAVKLREEDTALLLLHRLHDRIRRCEGTDPEWVRRLYSQIIMQLRYGAERMNLSHTVRAADSLLYTVSRQETLQQLCRTVQELAQEYFAEEEPLDMAVVSRVDRYLEQHYRTCTLQDMADELGFTHTYLCAAYKKGCGKTINQRLTALRMEHAMELLSSTSGKLYDVARDVGYADGKYFVKLFTRETGISPREYRERHRNDA